VEAIANMRCGKCNTPVIVFPPSLRSMIPDEAQKSIDEQMGKLRDDDDGAFAVADGNGYFKCPNAAQTGTHLRRRSTDARACVVCNATVRQTYVCERIRPLRSVWAVVEGAPR
jgi:hypothetical protein